MENILFEQKDGRYILSIDKSIASDNVIQDFVARLRFDELSKKADYNTNQLSEIGDYIKTQWWNRNKETLMQRIENYQP